MKAKWTQEKFDAEISSKAESLATEFGLHPKAKWFVSDSLCNILVHGNNDYLADAIDDLIKASGISKQMAESYCDALYADWQDLF